MNKFYGIGVGVGDQEEITVKAVRILKTLDVVVLPEAKKDDGSTAYDVAKNYLRHDVEKIFIEFPMLKSLDDRIESRKKNSKIIEKLLLDGKNVGFLTIGDPMTYSTYVYLLEYLSEKFSVQTIAGISSFVDMASRFNFPLVIGDENLKIISLNKETDIEYEINNSDNIIFMKISRNFLKLKNIILKTNNGDNIILVSNCGKKNQKFYYDISDLDEKDIPYFSTLILKKGGFSKWKKFTL